MRQGIFKTVPLHLRKKNHFFHIFFKFVKISFDFFCHLLRLRSGSGILEIIGNTQLIKNVEQDAHKHAHDAGQHHGP